RHRAGVPVSQPKLPFAVSPPGEKASIHGQPKRVPFAGGNALKLNIPYDPLRVRLLVFMADSQLAILISAPGPSGTVGTDDQIMFATRREVIRPQTDTWKQREYRDNQKQHVRDAGKL